MKKRRRWRRRWWKTHHEIQRVDDGSGILIVERDPGLRCQIWDHPVNAQEQARKAYVKHGPYQIQKNVYPVSDARHPRRFQNLSSVADLCHQLAKTGKSVDYYLIDRSCNILTRIFVSLIITSILTVFSCRLIRLVLTLPVSTATTERAFSAMKLVKTRLRNKMEDGFLRDCLLIYIEKEIAIGFSTDEIIDEFNTEKRRVAFD